MRIVRRIKVQNDLGLHIRPAAFIVKILQKYKSQVYFTCEKDTINARSIMSILTLVAKKNMNILIIVDGKDAKIVMKKLMEAFNNGFGEK